MQKIKDFLYYNRKEIFTVVICLLSFITINIFNQSNTSISYENIENEIIKEENNKIVIEIKGEINNPGTYEFTINDRIIDAIEKSGGLKENADVSNINLSEKLKDEMVIIIPIKEENDSQNIVVDNKQNDIKSNTTKVDNKSNNDGKVSINTASISELMTIKGIGEKKAIAIVEYREKNGLFKDIKDITKVSGIGNSTFEKIKDYIKI